MKENGMVLTIPEDVHGGKKESNCERNCSTPLSVLNGHGVVTAITPRP